MKLKERLRIAWQVLTKGTISTLNPHSSAHFFERKRKIEHFTYTHYSIDYPDKVLWLNDVDRIACEKIVSQLLQRKAIRVSGKYRPDIPSPIERTYEIDVLMPEE